MHSYWSSIFILPKVVVKEVEKLCRSFLWHGTDKGNKGGLMSWVVVCQNKACGGLGVKPMLLWNQAAIMKYMWELIMEKNTSWAMWVTQVNLERLSFWGITKPTDCSWSWKNLLKLREVAKAMFVYKLGDGKKFLFWYDPWCNGHSLADLFPEVKVRDSGLLKKSRVCKFWRNGCWRILNRWNSDMMRVLNF